MKNLGILLIVLIIASCSSMEKQSVQEERSVGFNTKLPEKKWHLGTEQPIQVVKALDTLWAKKDWESMKAFCSDTAKFYFHDGRIAKSPDEFIQILSDDSEGVEDSWTFDYAFSVDLDPTRGGEHVQAGFTGTSVKDSVVTKKHYHEWYYIVEGKIVMWRQFTSDIKE